MALSLKYDSKAEEFSSAMQESELLIRRAGESAVRQTATLARDNARKNIAGAGFTKRWINAMGFRMEKTPSDSVAAAVVFHAIPYAIVFEEGATIRGKPLLWLPIEANLPSGKWTPKKFSQRFGPLVVLRLPGKKPLLFLKRVQKGVERKPLFVGVDSVTLRKRFAIYDAINEAVSHMDEFYDAALEGK